MVKEKAPRRTQSLRDKLTTLVVVAIFGAVAVVTASSVWREIIRYGASRTVELEVSANVIAAAIADHVRSNDRDATLFDLRAIASAPTIDYILVETAGGKHFLEYGDESASTSSEISSAENMSELGMLYAVIATRSIVVQVPIVIDGEYVGDLTVHADASALPRLIGVLIYDAFVAALFAGGIGVLIAARMQRSLTNPIRHLAGIMSKVRERRDFNLRARRTSNDEAGELVDSFNEMLNQIQMRDAQLVAHQRDLKKIVRKRTLQLQKAKESAEAANHAKTEFLATVSHEIRTPLNGMQVMAELLKETKLAPRQKRYADVIVKSGQSLLAIINDILDFSKIEAGRLELEKIPVNPADIVDDVVGLFWERAAAAGLDLASYAAPNTPDAIVGDSIRISQVLSNLVNNAIKFTTSGHVTVSVNLFHKNETSWIEFAVADTGVGIATEKRQAIFEAFSQADQSTSRKFGGTGLGLAICQRLLKAMGGEIEVESVQGEGSKFTFSFPTRILKPPRPAPRSGHGRQAIIAVSGAATVEILARYLRETGLEVSFAEHDGAPIHSISYTDIIFASPDALDTLNAAAKGDPGRWIPLRVCVSELGDSESDRLLETGVAEDIVIRPISRRDVMKKIARLFNGSPDRHDDIEITLDDSRLPSFAGRRILAADDSAINREVVEEALVKLGADPMLASDGDDAVEMAKKNAFDLIIMDCSMPGMDGFDATRAIRQFEREAGRKRTPVIALTAHIADMGGEWREAGMDYYLTKPFTLDALAAALEEFLQSDPSPVEGAGQSKRALDASEETPIELTYDDLRTNDLSEAGVFDFAVLKEIARMQSDTGDLVARALDLFEIHSKKALEELVAAVRAGDGAALGRTAHALKSMSLNAGARRLAAACEEVETRALDGPDERALAGLILSIRNEYEAALSALPATRAKFSSEAA